MKLSQHLGRYRWKGDHITSLSDREDDRELADAWERYLAQTLARQKAEQEATAKAQAAQAAAEEEGDRSKE